LLSFSTCIPSIPSTSVFLPSVLLGGENTIVVASVPGAILTDWRRDVAAILVNFMPGQENGNALAAVLVGDVNPSGRLPITFPNVENEVGFTPDMYPGVNLHAAYREELLVGYRWYNAKFVTPAFPFGHGLSYTSFDYSNLTVSHDFPPSAVSVSVTNIGKVAGNEVVLFYVTFPASANEPPHQLKHFSKTALLTPNQSATVAFSFSPRDLSIWNTASHSWELVSGVFTLSVCRSALPLDCVITTSFSS
jgi:beta-glucosidase